jgi:hypothetical protein
MQLISLEVSPWASHGSLLLRSWCNEWRSCLRKTGLLSLDSLIPYTFPFSGPPTTLFLQKYLTLLYFQSSGTFRGRLYPFSFWLACISTPSYSVLLHLGPLHTGGGDIKVVQDVCIIPQHYMALKPRRLQLDQFRIYHVFMYEAQLGNHYCRWLKK